jgi:hypothetical protein
MNAVLDMTTRPGPTILRLATVRWLTAEVIPFGSLALGIAIAKQWHPVMVVGYMFALFGTYILTILYLHKVVGAAIGWCLSVFPLLGGIIWVAGVTIVGSATTQSGQSPATETKITPTPSWWIAGICLAIMLGLVVAAATATGEHWLHRNRSNLPLSKAEACVRSRGKLARLWLPR